MEERERADDLVVAANCGAVNAEAPVRQRNRTESFMVVVDKREGCVGSSQRGIKCD
jgi:hypothetical protein